jgi:hypothetical protein
MEKEFVPYQESLELKQLGFDEPCMFAYRNSDGEQSLMSFSKWQNFTKHDNHDGFAAAPLYQQAFRFFREKFNLEYQIIKSASDSYSAVIHLNTREYLDKILTLYNACVAEVVDCYSYEEVELDCLRKLIEIVKNK